jgi:hypothetical protein
MDSTPARDLILNAATGEKVFHFFLIFLEIVLAISKIRGLLGM